MAVVEGEGGREGQRDRQTDGRRRGRMERSYIALGGIHTFISSAEASVVGRSAWCFLAFFATSPADPVMVYLLSFFFVRRAERAAVPVVVVAGGCTARVLCVVGLGMNDAHGVNTERLGAAATNEETKPKSIKSTI